MSPAIAAVVAYLLGSIPFGYLIVKGRKREDVRGVGSGGTGATNVSRAAGKLAGVLTLLLDAGKGAAAILFAEWYVTRFAADNRVVAIAAVAVLVGHCFPVWLKFRGGKGVATAIGVFIVLCPLAILGASIVFVPVVWATRFVSLGSILGAISVPIFIALLRLDKNLRCGGFEILIAGMFCVCLIVLTHRANIGRLLNGTEHKFE